MKTVLKWTLLLIGLLLLFVGGALFTLNRQFESSMAATYEVEVAQLEIPTDSASIAAGEKWGALCMECHGANLGGKLMFEAPGLASLYASNLTPGNGGIGATYRSEDWIRAIRHGIKPNGKSVIGMPSHEYQYLDEKDLVNTVAFLQTFAPVDYSPPTNEFTIQGKALIASGAMGKIFAAEHVDHDAPIPSGLVAEVSEAYGKYLTLTTGCQACHSEQLTGGNSPDPASPPAPDITSSGNLGSWSLEEFSTSLRTGKTPEGKEMEGKFMPWPAYAKMDSLNIEALYVYLQSLSKAAG
ncbi:MAG: cytochrome c [Bacteroidota bacterium]